MTLKKVIIVARHGIRNPKRVPENWNFKVPAHELGKLTHLGSSILFIFKGRKQMLDLGTYVRNKYWALVESLTPKEVYVRSTESHR
jgi:hypothetical protein